jgi:hypothetical protein
MLRRWIRCASARIGIRLPFKGVICVHGTQSVSLDREGRAEIKFRKLLVFLERPSPGDLRDVYALGTRRGTSAIIYMSPDAIEVSREEPEPGRKEITWLPRDAVILNALYEHQNGWRPSVVFDDPAVCVEYDCNMPTGIFTIELASSTQFDAAVLFKRPRWPLRLTERHIVRAALQRLKTPGPMPQISPDGACVIGEVQAPKIGDRYFLVAFRRCGVADCEQWLMQTSLLGRCQRTISGWAHAVGAGALEPHTHSKP